MRLTKNGKHYTRLLLATSDCPEACSSVASLVVQAYVPLGSEEFGKRRKAVVVLESKFRVDDTFRMQELHGQFGSLAVTAADNSGPARATQELRRICVELEALGDKVVAARRTRISQSAPRQTLQFIQDRVDARKAA